MKTFLIATISLLSALLAHSTEQEASLRGSNVNSSSSATRKLQIGIVGEIPGIKDVGEKCHGRRSSFWPYFEKDLMACKIGLSCQFPSNSCTDDECLMVVYPRCVYALPYGKPGDYCFQDSHCGTFYCSKKNGKPDGKCKDPCKNACGGRGKCTNLSSNQSTRGKFHCRCYTPYYGDECQYE